MRARSARTRCSAGRWGLPGTTHVGNSCILAGQVGTAGHLTIGDGATVDGAERRTDGCARRRDLIRGYPAMENLAWRKSVAVFNRLPELQRELRELREEIARLRARSACTTSGDYLPRISSMARRSISTIRFLSSAEASSFS